MEAVGEKRTDKAATEAFNCCGGVVPPVKVAPWPTRPNYGGDKMIISLRLCFQAFCSSSVPQAHSAPPQFTPGTDEGLELCF